MKNIAKALGLLVLLILLCTIIVRTFAGSETLAEYAIKNPDKAYSTTATSSE